MGSANLPALLRTSRAARGVLVRGTDVGRRRRLARGAPPPLLPRSRAARGVLVRGTDVVRRRRLARGARPIDFHPGCPRRTTLYGGGVQPPSRRRGGFI